MKVSCLVVDMAAPLLGDEGMTKPTLKGFIGALWFLMPLATAVLLNAIVRPVLAWRLDGEQVLTGARRPDIHWVFDKATQAEHPWLTGFLGVSNGAIALATLIIILVLFVWRRFLRASIGR